MSNLEDLRTFLNLLRGDTERIFPGAVTVEITITADDIVVRPLYKKTEGSGRKTLGGDLS